MSKPCSGFLRTLAFAGLLFSTAAVFAYPERPIRIVLPYPPGGGGDLVLRNLQPSLEKHLGQPVIVDYKSGAAGNIGTMEVVNAAPDGYTLLMAPTNNFVINQFLFPKMGFDPLTSLSPVSLLVEQPYLLTVSGALAARDFAEFAAYAKANPGKLNYGSPGSGTVPHISALMLSDHLAARMVHVPYKGSQPGVQVLIANDVQLFIASYGIVAGQISAGRIRALAVAADQRLPALAQVPTTAEVGLPPGLILSNWWGIAAPKGTGKEIVDRLAEAFKRAVNDQDVQRKFVEQGTLPVASSSQQFADRMRDEAQSWKAIITKTGVTVE